MAFWIRIGSQSAVYVLKVYHPSSNVQFNNCLYITDSVPLDDYFISRSVFRFFLDRYDFQLSYPKSHTRQF